MEPLTCGNRTTCALCLKEDWDEDAPHRIVDPAVSMPAGWLEEEPLKIADPKSQRRDSPQVSEDGITSCSIFGVAWWDL